MLRTTTVFLLAGLLCPAASLAQIEPNPTQRPVNADREQVPVFRVTVVGRTTPAVNYRPRSGDTRIDFAGTPLMPEAKGRATIRGQKGYIEINADFENVGPASQFGPEYLTYVVWAITPEGRAKNLGELQIKSDDGDVRVTTELQAFGLVVTAEPYFAVTQPSDVVVMENVVREGFGGTVGNIEVINAKYELLQRGTYLMNQAPGRLRVKPLEPGAPLDLAEARNAVELARLAGADRFAEDTFEKAVDLLSQAETARERRRGGNAVMMPARQAVQTAEDARLIALQKQEAAFITEQQMLSRDRETAALDRARAEEERRRQADLDRQNEETRRKQAELDKQAEEARRKQLENDKQAADAARAAAERARLEAERETARLAEERKASEAARQAAEAARLAAENQTQQAQAVAAQAEQEKAALRERLREQLNLILETRETARGLIVNLSDVLFDTASANLKPGAREKLAKIAGILLAHQGLQVAVEGHTDSVGAEGYNQRLSEQRADSVRSYLVRQGIGPAAVATAGFGESQPVASNTTSAGRQQNRRVELIVSGEAIGRR
jgi:outer membrane protein OmpA-like peptidoglycan-associated protein